MKLPRYGFDNLLFALVLVILVFPFVPIPGLANILMKLSLSILLLSSVYIFCHNKHIMMVALALAVPTLVSSWVTLINGQPAFVVIDNATNLFFFAFVIYQIGKIILNSKRVTRDIIFASLCVYMLLGLQWSFVYTLLEWVLPGSFVGQHFGGASDFNSLVYYSFMTLTTVGYGDIHPVLRGAQALASIEAITGQFYLTVLVARLVGTHISQSQIERDDDLR